MLSAWIILGPITMVCSLALAMSICSPGESATQFAIYMSVINIGYVLGSMVYGLLADYNTWSQNYAIKGLLVFVLLLTILMMKTHQHPEKLLEEFE